MARSREWLDRFRPAGGPGSPSVPGVPSDARHRADEFDVVFRLLVPTEQECARIRSAAVRKAAERRTAAESLAAAIRAGASTAASAARATAFTTASASAPASSERAAMAASVEDLRRRVRQRMPVVEAEVRRVLLEQLTDLGGVSPTLVPGSGSRS
ncbi:MAG TPA: hypothetical protein VLR26_12915 [Frankiaceae bacterium]|nr:hypothetical protein [Frankiaceae bacterium]